MPTIPPGSKDYPKYIITFDGDNLLDEHRNPVPTVELSGPHTFFIQNSDPAVTFELTLTHNPTDPGVPNLTIAVTKEE